MPQHDYMDRFRKEKGRRFDYEERKRKRLAREGHESSAKAQNLRGLRAKQFAEKRRKEKIQMKKQIRQKEQKNVKSADSAEPSKTPVPQYLLDRSDQNNAKALSQQIKNKRSEKAAKFSVPIPKVKGVSEEEMFKVVSTGKKTHKKAWKRVITKPTFVGNDFTRRPVKFERFIRPMGLRYKVNALSSKYERSILILIKKANVTHPELGVTVSSKILLQSQKMKNANMSTFPRSNYLYVFRGHRCRYVS